MFSLRLHLCSVFALYQCSFGYCKNIGQLPDEFGCSEQWHLSSTSSVIQNSETDQHSVEFKVTTSDMMILNANQRGCLVVHLPEKEKNKEALENATVDTLLYRFTYNQYFESYAVRQPYTFSYIELSPDCKCHCPESIQDQCHSEGFQSSSCESSRLCFKKHMKKPGVGCKTKSAADVCCELQVSPYKNKKYVTFQLGSSLRQAILDIDIYAYLHDKWNHMKNYKQRRLLVDKNQIFHLNGQEIVTDITLRAHAQPNTEHLIPTVASHYYFDSETGNDETPIDLFEASEFNSIRGFSERKAGYLRFMNGRYVIGGRPELNGIPYKIQVTNCMKQNYTVGNLVAFPHMLKGANEDEMAKAFGDQIGNPVEKPEFRSITLIGKQTTSDDGELYRRGIKVTYTEMGSPAITLYITLNQKVTLSTYQHKSYVANVSADIYLDSESNRFLNITLVDAYGSFKLEIFPDSTMDHLELSYEMITRLPFTSNYTSLYSMPAYIHENRLVCVKDAVITNNERKVCVRAKFHEEPLTSYKLPDDFIQKQGNCPECNVKFKKTSTFWDMLKPSSWLNGIDSVTEGVVMVLEIIVYIVIILFAIFIIRRIICPLLKCVCSADPAPEKKTRSI